MPPRQRGCSDAGTAADLRAVHKTLPPASLEARICSYECTFCATCVEPAGQSAMRPRCDMVQAR
jgi:hypothetical protein